MHNKFEINQTNIKGGCQSRNKVVSQNSKRDLPLDTYYVSKQISTDWTIKYVPWPLSTNAVFSVTVQAVDICLDNTLGCQIDVQA